jgi:hypothetical protein
MFCRALGIALLLSGAAAGSDLWNGIAPGRFAAGFRFQRTVDPTRWRDSVTPGTPLGMAIWYPAQGTAAGERGISQLEYRLLGFSAELSDQAKADFRDSEAEMMVAWRHVGIVPLTLDQARAALEARGRATRGAAAAPGRFPVVVILGGPFYLATTAEILASHGYLVVAPVRFSDLPNDVPALNFTWFVENAVRDAEWALTEMGRDAAADMSRVSAIGHGGGGLQALLLAMRDRRVSAVANIDAGNFSTRTNARQLIFYDPRLLRTPYLYIATAETRLDSDQFGDFEKMKFSRRYEVILEGSAIRHHDLSDIGRGVTAVLGIRGEVQDAVLRRYAEVQQMVRGFLDSPARFAPGSGDKGQCTFTVRDAVDPAPGTLEVLRSLDGSTLRRLTEAHRRDPEAPLFSEDEMRRVVLAARSADVARFALELHPRSLPMHQAASACMESAGETGAAREIAARCAAIEPPSNDWRAAAAQADCRARLRRLRQ